MVGSAALSSAIPLSRSCAIAAAGTAFLAPSLSSSARAPRSLPDSTLVIMQHDTDMLFACGQRQRLIDMNA